MGILGLGIMLGGYWAYEMLGWGGYWAWDPVENSSLIPWLVGVAGIHTLLVQRKSQAQGGIGKYAKTNLMLCVLTYVLVLYSTFLTRSGVLGDASVHSFVDPGMIVYLFLVLFIGTFVLLGFGMIAYRWKTLNEKITSEESILSRELALFTAMIVLIASAIIVLVGTSAPIFGQSVDTFFYNEMHLPLAIIIMLLNGLSLLIKWRRSSFDELVKKSTYAVGGSLLFTLVLIFLGGVHEIMIILLSFTSSFSLIVNLDIAIKIIRGNFSMLGAYVAHTGIALFILGVIGSAVYTEHIDLKLEKNKPTSAFGYEMTFTDLYSIENNTKYAFNVEVKKGNSQHNITPIMYLSDFNNSLVREPAILSMLTKDIYLSPLGYDQGEESGKGQTVSIGLGSEYDYENIKIKYLEFIKPDMSAMMSGGNIQMGTKLSVTKEGKTYEVSPMINRQAGNFEYIPVEVKDINLKIEVRTIKPETQEAEFVLSKIVNDNKVQTTPKEVLSVTASIKPFINLVWTGVLVMVVGFITSMVRRLKDSMIVS
jgi:cytochrome c-type biogenesis protein CcmF